MGVHLRMTPWTWLPSLPHQGPNLVLRCYKRKPIFRPKNPPKPRAPTDLEVSFKFQETCSKLHRLLQRFNKVDNIIEESRCRGNPFEPDILPMEMTDFKDIDVDSEKI